MEKEQSWGVRLAGGDLGVREEMAPIYKGQEGVKLQV